MEYKKYPPPSSLRELVQCFWSLQSIPAEVTPQDYYLMADSYPEIIFQYNGGFRSFSAQSSRMRFQHSMHARYEVGKQVGLFGVRLFPHAPSQLLGVPASELANQVIDFSALFQNNGKDLPDQVYAAPDTATRIRIVSEFLKQGQEKHKVDPVKHFLDQLVNHNGWVDIGRLQQESGLSVKQFERRFKAIAGFPPKYFARITRFQGLRNKYRSGNTLSLTRFAYACNYYDQSHFIREFKEFSGVQPFKYFNPVGRQNPGCGEFDGYLPCGWFV